MNEVQVVCTVMSADKVNDPDIAAMIGTSAALAISGLPFMGPIGGARVGFTEADGISSTRPTPSWQPLSWTWWWPGPPMRY